MKQISLLAIFIALAACSGHKKSAKASADQVNCLSSLKQPGVVKTAEDNSNINNFCKDSKLNSGETFKCAYEIFKASGGDTKTLADAKVTCVDNGVPAGPFEPKPVNGGAAVSPEGLVNHNEPSKSQITGQYPEIP